MTLERQDNILRLKMLEVHDDTTGARVAPDDRAAWRLTCLALSRADW